MVSRKLLVRLAAFGFLLGIAAGIALMVTPRSNAAPLLTTDKEDYFAAETVPVTGSGFAPNTSYAIPIIRPDGSIVKGDGSLSPGWDTVTSNGSGGFTYLYKLDGIFGTYEVRAYPSPWSGNLSESPITSMTFTDADIDFTQCSNDDNNDNVVEACKWVSGALNGNNSAYHESEGVPQRLAHKLTTVGAFQMQFEYDFSKGSIYSYDFLTSADQGPQNTLALLNPCADLAGFASGPCSTITNALYTGATPVTIPSDTFDSVSGAEAAIATREFKVACSGPGACSATAAFFPCRNAPSPTCPVSETNDVAGADETNDAIEAHYPDTDPDCINTVAPRCGTSSVTIRLSVTTPAGTSNSSPTIVYVWFGGHLSYAGYWGATGCGTGGTDGCGSSSISGAPFHLQYTCLDEPDSPDTGCNSVGNRDNQISPGTVQQGTINIVKNAVPDHAQDFSFTCSSPLGSFSLDDDADGTLSNSTSFSMVTPGTYTCTESAPSAGWTLTALVCVDPDSGTSVNLGTRTATIDLDNLETITCTYTNTGVGNITIIKDAAPNDAQDFGFLCSSTLGGFSLDDDANGTLSNTKAFTGVAPGSYMCTESIPPTPWELTMISCSDPDGGTTTNVGTLTATIDLDVGETVVCTFTNVKQGNVTIIKDADPNHAQDFSFTGTCFAGFSLDDDADGTLSNTKTGNIAVSSCTVIESAPPSGWSLTSISCSDPDSGTAVNVGTRTATIDVDAGETIVCTFTNTGIGTISITKDAVPNDAQDFAYSGTCFAAFSLDDDADGTLSNNKTATHTPGSCTVIEGGPPSGWALTSLVCTDPDGGTTTAGATATIDLDPGETVSCTYTNTKQGQIIVNKVCDPLADPQTFSFTPSYNGGFILGCGGSNTSAFLSPGTYSVSESVPVGWLLTGSNCSDGSSVASIGLSAGETVTCTFTNTKTGTITIIKDAVPDDTQGFFFTCTTSTLTPFVPASFTLDDNGSVGDPFDNSKTQTGLLPGTYTCSESLPTGWQLTSLVCVDPSGGTTTTATPVLSPGTGTATIALAAGESVTCTFTNTMEGKITITKDAVPNDAQDFSFTCSASIGSFSLDDDADGTLSNSKSTSGLLSGTYTCTENGPLSGWTLTNISCSDPNGNTTVNVGTRTATMVLDAGEQIACTFTNTGAGNISITKDTVPNGPQDFCFNGDLPDVNGVGTGDFCLDDDADGTLSNTHIASVSAGTYNVNELGPTTGFDLTSLSCTDPDGGTTTNLVTATASIDLDPSESITCTFTNTQRGTVIVNKTAAGGDDTFSYTATGLDLPGAFSIATSGGSGSQTFSSVRPGAKSLTEGAPPAGWYFDSLLCDDGTVSGQGVSFTLDAGETVTCTFTNVKNGNVAIDKTCVGGNDTFNYTGTGTGIAASFSITCSGGSGSQSFNDIADGAKTVVETVPPPPAGWQFTSLVCSDPDNGTSVSGPTAYIDLDPGETVTCTYTNTQDGTITIIKDAVPNDPQDFTFTCPAPLGTFSLDDDADGTLSNTNGPVSVAPNTYNCSEAAVTGWTQTSATCSDGSPVNAINVSAGENVTCTFTNTKDGTITIIKDAVPNDAQDFSFTCSAPLGTFSLDDDADGTLSNSNGPVMVAPGTYSCSEATVSGWTQTSATCSDSSLVSAINLAPGESVTCTFANTKDGSITIIKDAQPDHAQDFSFTCSAPIGSFSLDDDADGTLPNTKGPVSVAAGTYSCSEAAMPLWTASPSCSDGSPVSAINVSAGENVTCTFTNVGSGAITIIKDAIPNEPQDFSFGGTCFPSFNLDDDADGTLSNTKTASHSVGSCTVIENGPVSGWNFISLLCTDPDGGTTIGGQTANIDLDVGETVVCTYTNTKSATVMIVKDTVPDAPQDFSIACGGLGVILLDDDANATLPNSHQFSNVVAGTYTCTETNVAGYQITISCSDPDGGSTVSPPSATIDADSGETVTCTFVNTFHPGGNPVGGIAGLLDEDQASQRAGSAGTPGSLLGLLGALMASMFVLLVTGVVIRRSTR